MSEVVTEDEISDRNLAEIGRYARLAAARERGLVVAAMGRAYWIVRRGREYVLCVENADRAAVETSVAEYEREEQGRTPIAPPEPLNIPFHAVIMTVLALVLTFVVQGMLSGAVVESGVSDDLKIRAGEWWRVFTAMTLHGDSEHLISNLSLGLFACAFVYARFGVGVGLLATLLSGAAGNALNVLVHWYEPHRSIGSSTALFAGLGLLAGAELAARLRREDARGFWSLIVPLGAGLTFLSLFGGGGFERDGRPILTADRVDIWAHLLGLVAGVALGAVFQALGWRRGVSARWQVIAGLAAGGFLALAWSLARNFGISV